LLASAYLVHQGPHPTFYALAQNPSPNYDLVSNGLDECPPSLTGLDLSRPIQKRVWVSHITPANGLLTSWQSASRQIAVAESSLAALPGRCLQGVAELFDFDSLLFPCALAGPAKAAPAVGRDAAGAAANWTVTTLHVSVPFIELAGLAGFTAPG
jgi:hypothetical protein